MDKQLLSFLEQRKIDFHDRGTHYMVPMVEEMLQMDLTVDDLQEFVVECKAERDRHTQYNLKFMYYWAVQTYLQDMVDCFKREINQKGAVQ